MIRSLIATLVAALLLTSPAIAKQANDQDAAALVKGCWSGVTWDELGIKAVIGVDAD